MKILRIQITVLLAICAPYATAAGDIAAGQAKAAVCAACHGADGNSTTPDWPNLAGQHAGYIEKQLNDLQAGETRANAMMAPMIAGLSAEDMADLAAFYASQPASGGFVSEERLAAGERLFRSGNAQTGVPACMGCHGPDGSGNPLGGFPKLSGQHAKYIAKQLTDFQTGERSNDAKSMMRNAVRFLSRAEIEAVAEYVGGLH